jgi:hypothetical protein
VEEFCFEESFDKDIKVKMSADMSDSVKQKRPIHCPLFHLGFSFHMQGISNLRLLLSIESHE